MAQSTLCYLYIKVGPLIKMISERSTPSNTIVCGDHLTSFPLAAYLSAYWTTMAYHRCRWNDGIIRIFQYSGLGHAIDVLTVPFSNITDMQSIDNRAVFLKFTTDTRNHIIVDANFRAHAETRDEEMNRLAERIRSFANKDKNA